ncbi:extracellular solute-binding protein [Paenibacillus tepidiphilus]|uniref:ABC transporter substrate-binding protein n=1 Tax=Paenibacillus tepidiphilus TaxID=2608683 RepID=UPI0012399813|nr:extracellular solute-binding protein [Paenibacillus tepidiphilus]
MRTERQSTPYSRSASRLTLALLLLLGGGCTPAASHHDYTEPEGPAALTVWLIPGSGLEPLIEEYQLRHPELDIQVQISTYTQLPVKLQTALATGSSSPDIASIDIGYLDRFKQFPEHFYNLYDYGAAGLRDRYLGWKWQEAQSGGVLFGLPTDIGPYALVYRPDIFAGAGLPGTAAEVAKQLGTWDSFLETGRIIREHTGKAFINNLEDLYIAILRQSPLQYYSPDGELLVERSPQVKAAWDIAIRANELQLSAHTAIDTQKWGTELLTGDFAVMLCPAWMIGHIKSNAPTASGMWRMTQIPGSSANRGGSVLTLPRSGSHPEASYALVSWLTAPEQQLAVFEAQGNFPSTPEIYGSPEIREQRDPYFGNAPAGQVYAESAQRIKPTYYGPQHLIIEENMLQHLTRAELGELNPAEAWSLAVQKAKELDASYR